MSGTIGNTPAKGRIIMKKGVDFTPQFTWSDENGQAIDLTPYTMRLVMKEKRTDTAFLVDVADTDANITLNGVSGVIDIAFTIAEIDAFTWDRGYFEWYMTTGGNTECIMEGSVQIKDSLV